MDDYNLNVLSEAKNEYSSRLLNIITPLVIQGVKSIFNEAVELCNDNDENEKYLMTFQNFLSRVPNWNSNIIKEETQRVITASKCNYLEDLLTCVHITQVKILTSIRVSNQQKKIDIDIPKLGEFIHSVYINFARKLYKNIYLFEKDIMPLDYQKNMRECEVLCRESVLEVIRDSMPIEHILRAYMDETVHEEILEETLEKEVTEGEAIDMLEEAKKNIKDKQDSKDISVDKIGKVEKALDENTVTVEEPALVSSEKTKDISNNTESTATLPDAAGSNAAAAGSNAAAASNNSDIIIKELEDAVKKENTVKNTETQNANDIIIKSITNNPEPAMEKPKRTSITFNDKDAILDMGTNNETFVDAPKTAERLEDIRKKANERRKREEEDDFADDEFDDGPINIMGDNISLDIMDIQDLSESPKIIEDDLLNDIEILA
jgi:hypothetical protein